MFTLREASSTILDALRASEVLMVNMDPNELSVEGLRRRIASLVGKVQLAFRNETGVHYDDRLIAAAMSRCLANKLDGIEEDMFDMFTTPHRAEYRELAAFLERHAPEINAAVEIEECVYLAQELGEESLFTGLRPFSPSKYAAMMRYLTSRGKHVYKTSLNKLLFYSDLTSFYLTGQGISGATYANRPFGPVAEPAESILRDLIAREEIRVDDRMKTLTSSGEAETGSLTDADQRILDWVIETYGDMKAGEISQVSHAEHAYRFTEPNEPIAYAYGKFFKKLPPPDLLSQ